MIQLGPFQLDHPFVLAPMAGITHSPFRRLMRRYNSAFVVSELISARGMQSIQPKTLELLKFHEEERKVGFQIFGEDPFFLCQAAQQIEKLGVDFVDLNLGCPVPKIVKRGAGAAMCRHPITLGKILEALVKAIQIPLSIKIRIGWDEESKNALEIVRIAAQAGVAWVSIHGRTRAQGYEGKADWDFIGDIKAKSTIPIIGNGDINTPEAALEKLQKYHLDAVMIGRGALRNPFIFEQAYALWKGEKYLFPQASDYLNLIQEQKKLFQEFFNEKMAGIFGKKFLAWYAAGFPHCHEFRAELFRTLDVESVWNQAIQFFQTYFQSRDPQALDQAFLMSGHG